LLKQRNTHLLEQLFWAVSDPQNEQYGKHITLDELTTLIAPTDETIESVSTWLNQHGVTNYKLTHNMDKMRVTVDLHTLEKLVNVTFKAYVHPKLRQIVWATVDKYSVPEDLADHIDLIAYVSGLPTIPKDRVHLPAAATGLEITPAILWARYNVTGWTQKATGNMHAVAEFQSQFYSPTDLDTFFQKFVTNSKESTVAKVIGTNTPTKPGDEASLDIQYLMGVAPNITTWFYSQAKFNFYNDLINWLTELNNETVIPFVHSVSYGSQGDYPSASYQSRSDQEYQKLGARGVSIIYASGDSGAQCESRCKVMEASYPAISVYVTAIGATAFISGNSGPERAVTAFKSGGGFSNYNPYPSYQVPAVPNYLKQNVQFPPTGSYNVTGRGNPDFSANGDVHYQVIVGGRTFSIGGTSASSPTFAAIISMLNDGLLAKGQSTLGFLNTRLYQLAGSNPTAFFDVTIGDNKDGCQGQCPTSNNGFLCTPQWDAVTGYGTPNFAVLNQLIVGN